MTREDYELIAKILRENSYCGETPEETIDEIAFDFAQVLSADNPRFDRVRFLDACGVN